MKREAMLCAVVLAVAACEVAPSGPQSRLTIAPPSSITATPSGPGATQSPVPPTNSGYIYAGLTWADATGTVVAAQWSGLPTDTPLFLTDVAWWVDAETGTIDAAQHQISTVYYGATDCSGLGRVAAPLARQPFKVPGETAYRWRPHTMASTLTAYAAVRVNGGACTPIAGSTRTVPLDASTVPPYVIKDPSPFFTPPLHLEANEPRVF